MSGKLGQEVRIQYPRVPYFEDSLFSVDPIHALFGILDFAFIVKIILSLCVLLAVLGFAGAYVAILRYDVR